MAIRPNCSGRSRRARIMEMINWIPCWPIRSKKLQKRACNVLFFNPSDIFYKLSCPNRVWIHDSKFVSIADASFFDCGHRVVEALTLKSCLSSKKQKFLTPSLTIHTSNSKAGTYSPIV